MKRRKILKKLTASILTLSMVASLAFIGEDSVFAEENNKSASQRYVEAMGKGWNLGNSFDGFDADLDKEDQGEEAWGNPIVTRELISEIKEKGYDSIRIPFTAYRRYSEVDGKYVIDQGWLDRYKEVVNWALEEELYVMVNLHHDSWIWLADWDGNKESEEYKIFVDLWEQLADAFKDFPEEVCFETINEPRFNEGDEEFKQDKLDMINLASYEVIRNSGGKNDTRMIVMPTMDTNHSPEKSNPLKELITSLNTDLVMKFSKGADWHQYLVKYTEPVLWNSIGTTDGFSIPTKFNGAKLRRATAYDKDGNVIGPNSSWWSYLQYTSAFIADYENETIEIYNNFFNDSSVTDGEIKFTFEFYDGQVVDYTLVKDGANITGTGNKKIDEDDDAENPGDDNDGEETPGDDEDNQNPGTDDSDDKNEGGNGSVNSKPENTNPSTNSGKDKLPQTGAVISTTAICGLALILIAIGGVVLFKKRECNK